ncbi:MAG: sensor histidine kinase [Actinomycetota bacterium]|nr:sensor histidine kinase [Actinomycetota bacterium]
MILTYLLYAFPFFIISIIILVHIERDSQFFFAKNLWLLALFAVTHGTHELIEMLSGFEEPARNTINFADAFTLAFSYYCLLQFGINCLVKCKQLSAWYRLLPTALAIPWVAILATAHIDMGIFGGEGDVFARYILGIPGCFLTAYAFMSQRPGLKNTGQPALVRAATLTATGFVFYGLLSGLITPPAGFFPASVLNYTAFQQKTGIPIQLARATNGAFIAYGLMRLVRVFDWEAADSARKENEKLWRTVKERTSELEKANKAIAESLREKDTLLRELYHRTKNNLQLVSSFIGLQARYINDTRSLQMLTDSQNRIQAMSLVHERLYKTRGLSSINMREYIKDLAEALISSYKRQGNVILKLAIEEDISFDIDTAIPCGLIINELMTNSLKYAFPHETPGEVSISMRKENGKIRLMFADDGTGLPEGTDPGQVKSLGLKLFHNLATKQLKGDVKLGTNKGAWFEVAFTPGITDGNS